MQEPKHVHNYTCTLHNIQQNDSDMYSAVKKHDNELAMAKANTQGTFETETVQFLSH